jgi:hypothetical protein
MNKNEFLRLHDIFFNKLVIYFVCLLFGFMQAKVSIDTILLGLSGFWMISKITIYLSFLIIGFIGFFTYLNRLRYLIAEYKIS